MDQWKTIKTTTKTELTTKINEVSSQAMEHVAMTAGNKRNKIQNRNKILLVAVIEVTSTNVRSLLEGDGFTPNLFQVPVHHRRNVRRRDCLAQGPQGAEWVAHQDCCSDVVSVGLSDFSIAIHLAWFANTSWAMRVPTGYVPPLLNRLEFLPLPNNKVRCSICSPQVLRHVTCELCTSRSARRAVATLH